MICTYCRAQNGADDHRCGRCGRHLTGDSPKRNFPVQTAAVAPALHSLDESVEEQAPIAATRPRLVTMPSAPSERAAAAASGVQAPLFPVQEVPRTMTSRPVKQQAPMSPAPSMRRKAARAAQPSLFDMTHEGSRTLPTSVEAAVCCDADVASASDRAWAAVIDTAIPMLGFVMFASAFYAVTGGLELTAKTLPWIGGIFCALLILYRAAWCAAGFDTPGLQIARLRLLTLDGRTPSRSARVLRTVGGLVSLASVGMGLLWGLVDEERLTWHDHMSGTFPVRRD
jgi:uncharacterized RDD family membrane protein YckC